MSVPQLMPQFRRLMGKNGPGTLALGDSEEALREKRTPKLQFHAALPEVVKKRAEEAVKRLGGNTNDVQQVLGQYELQFGAYRGRTFQWVLSNALGYAGYVVDKMDEDGERNTGAPLSENKFALKQYLLSFAEGREAVEGKKMQRQGVGNRPVPVPPSSSSSFSSANLRPASRSGQLAHLIGSNMPVDALKRKVSKIFSSTSTAAAPPPPTPTLHVPSVQLQQPELSELTAEELADDAKLVASVEALEANLSEISTASVPVPSSSQNLVGSSMQATCPQEFPLFKSWRESLPPADHQWVSRALFKWSASGKPEIDYARLDKMWWHPPEPSVACNHAPKVERYFSHRLFLWMPRKLWRFRLTCPSEACHDVELTSAGIHSVVRQVLNVAGFYNMASECLECHRCHRKFIAWSQPFLEQLDIGHRLQFPAILTYKLACDVQVIRLLRNRGLGNGPFQLCKKLAEQHHEVWLQKCARYFTDCSTFVQAGARGLLERTPFSEPPRMPAVPKYQWIQAVYVQDVMERAKELKASITSTLGRVLKMDSTKKVARKLGGQASKTAEWCTNVGNEYGQVLMSVLTAKEGCGLDAMTRGLVSRYSAAGAPPPVLLYVDRDCCSQTTRAMFSEWKELHIRLDVWHFMRRIASGCTTDSHPLYKVFMGRLSQCIFQWDRQDLSLLKEAKRQEFLSLGVEHPSEEAVINRISQRDLARHCRRATRPPQDIAMLVQQLLEAYDGDQGRDTLGVPLLNSERAWDEWEKAKVHVACLQDPPGVQLYTELGTMRMGGVELKTYRCARGSTSLESFHLHLTRFIPETSANDLHFQAYLLEGLVRWNKDRAQAATGEDCPSYSSLLHHAVNKLSEEILQKPLVTGFQAPRKFTGELIGVEYLYQQTGRALKDMKEEAEDTPAAAADDEEEVAERDTDEGFDEGHVDYLTIASAEEVIRPVPPVPRPKPAISAPPSLPLQQVLEHGVRVPQPSLTSAEPLPPAVERPKALNVGDAPQHDFELQRNTAGTATVRSRLKPVPDVDPLMTQAGRFKPILPKGEPVQPPLPVPRTTLWYRKKRMQETGVEWQVKKRKLGITCGQCGQERLPETHRQFYGQWWCQVKAAQTAEDWVSDQRANMRLKKEKSKLASSTSAATATTTTSSSPVASSSTTTTTTTTTTSAQLQH